MYDKTKYIYVGLDLHKEQHTAVIMDCFNEKLGEVTFQNKPSEFSKLLVKAKRFCTDGKGIVFALENSYGYGRALAAWLIERNYIVKDVNPALSYAYRKSVPQYKKNDSYDAQCVARVAINELNKLPDQVHHFATNKSKKYTSQFESITKKYGLDLDGDWNKQSMPRQGRHLYAYHDYVLDNMQKFDRIANGDKTKFLKLYDQMKEKIINNPEMLYKDYWKK